ncbi:orotate phosphoribosyltransferase [Campylobacter canadensis]|uniref:Orotate phosphoribosyltransferase n=1 Tax=Campylobacter canadensis TaxID=449520 RepID=A0ABS7WUW5_9BACT|nr:orotate phosphoribosyltransferase [Campylobacter canadensis]MBZ7988122.1 orotate phosphoribosyltransferase [Campylobacter canadensis]MBZ7995580.1 orotate phosphoribosyltransferase [Campylobacter canadensis]MBZ7997255.1 orotate phosphoribosyltransferase [Campylobacter canadensis]MBZ7999110.1 orotate phosphoribosyltransferase [Campylobacter canadensis]MBZ8000909.1 orotate phosphoribosyltransferase [Campylobacter canadensis]
MSDVRNEVVKVLKDCGAIFINTKEFFTYSSGIKSPIYCDNRVLISYPTQRTFIANELAKLIMQKAPDCEIIAATATGAIAHGAWVAQILNKPLVYILSKNKTHGRAKMIEGVFELGQKCVIIEDLISSGQSSINALLAARAHGLNVDKIFSIFSYELNQAKENFAKNNCECFSLSGFSAFSSMLNEDELKILNEWRNAQK